MAVFSKLYNAFRSQVETTGLPGETQLDARCISCAEKKRVQRWNEIKRGDHIIMKGENFMFNLGGRQISPYTHHAIVKDVTQTDTDSSAMITFIHFFITPFDTTLKIQETTNLMDFLYYEIYVLKYRHQTHEPDEIVRRAEEIMTKNANIKYYTLVCNCEHFCNWCCVGQEKSLQVDSLHSVLQTIAVEVGSFLSKILRVVLRFVFVSLEDLTKVAATTVLIAPWGVLALNAFLYLIYTIWKHNQLDKKRQNGTYCPACCLRKKQELWMSFIAYCCLQVGGLGLVCFLVGIAASKGIIIGALLLCSAFSLVFMKLIPKIRKIFGNPFEGRRVTVRNLYNIWVADVISFDHWKMSHNAVVKSVEIFGKKKGKITVIHYSLPSVFGRRKVVEEVIDVDLSKDFITSNDYTGYKVYPPEIVVKRAEQRIGETKFGFLSNRSCHFCHWAKVDYGESSMDEVDSTDQPVNRLEMIYAREVNLGETLSGLQSIHIDHRQGRKHSTKRVEKTWAKIRDDIHKGFIISFKYKGFWHKAICTDVRFSDQRLSMLSLSVVHYGKNCMISEDMFNFDLNTQDIWIYKHHPVYSYVPTEVIRRARSKLGACNYNMLMHRSTHFVQEIAMKDINPAVCDFDEIKTGDVLQITYWGLNHDVVVTDTKKFDSKPNTTGEIHIVHYALDSLFSARYVKEEVMEVDLQADLIRQKNYKGYFSYPNEMVVKRARSRLGERRYNMFKNTSSDLAHWAKVLQTSAVVIQRSQTGHTEKGEQYIVVPREGKVDDGFQRRKAHSWLDLQPGIIVEYYYYWIKHQGILTSTDERNKKIFVIHYGTSHLFATRTIMEDEIKLDIARDSIWIYSADPRKCYRSETIVDNARKRLGEQRWKSGNRSWDFCKDCVLKKKSKEE